MRPTLPTTTVLFLALAAWTWAPTRLPAATRTKANNTDNLNLASSWTNGIVPVGTDMALFESTVTGPLTVALGADLAWNQINFNNPGGDFTIGAGNRLTLSNNTPITFAAGTANLIFDCDLYCAGASFTTLPAAPTNRTVTYNGAIQGRNATVTLGNNTGTLRLGSSLSRQIGSVVQVTTANLKLGIGASSVGDPVASGPLGTNLFQWSANSPGTELLAYNGDQTLGNPVRVQLSPLNFNSADDLTFTGVVDLNNGNRTINVTGNATGLTKTGGGVLELGGTNVAALGSGLSIFGGAVRLLTNNVIPDGPGKGTLRMINTAHVLDLNGFRDTINGMAGSGGVGNWVGTVDNTAAGTTSVLTVGDDFTYTLLGKLQNSGPGSRLALVKTGGGGLILSNANTFSGGITNVSGSPIFLNAPGAAGTGPVVVATPDSAAALVSGIGSGTLVLTNDLIVETGAQPACYAALNPMNSLPVRIEPPRLERRSPSETPAWAGPPGQPRRPSRRAGSDA